MKERIDLIKDLDKYQDEYCMNFDTAEHMRLLIQDLKIEEDEELNDNN